MGAHKGMEIMGMLAAYFLGTEKTTQIWTLIHAV